MKIEKKHGLLVASMTIFFRGKSKVIPDLVIDTGAVHSIISLDEVDSLGIVGELGDEIVYMHGIGGTEQALKKTRGHYCWYCKRILPNEKFTGRGHSKHLCRKCMTTIRTEKRTRMKI